MAPPIALLCCAAGGLGFLLDTHPGPGTVELVDGALLTLGGLAAASSLARQSRDERLARALTAGALATALFELVAGHTLGQTRIGPFLSPAVPASLLSLLLLASAASRLLARRESEPDLGAWLEAGILTCAIAVVSWAYLLQPLFEASGRPVGEKLAGIAPSVLDVLLVGTVFRIVLSRGRRDLTLAGFALGCGTIAAAGLAAAHDPSGLRASAEGRVQVAWLAGYLFVAVSATVPRSTGARRPYGSFERLRLAPVLVALVVPEAVIAHELDRRHELGLNTLTIGTATAALVVGLSLISGLRLLRRARLAELHRGEARLSALITHSADSIFLVDRDGHISFASPSAEALWRRSSGTLIGSLLCSLFLDDYRAPLVRRLESLAGMPAGTTVPVEGHIRTRGGQIHVLEGIACNLLEDENIGALVVTLRDTTSRRELELQLERRAFHDELTGLANRALFADRLTHALKRSAREEDERIAVLFIDLDDFKAVNDGLGHGAGDELIRGVAERIRTNVRPGDTVARLGGDEFAVLLEDIPTPDHAQLLAERLLEVLELPIDVIGVGLAVPASVGVTFAARDSNAESLLRDADIAMYSAKSQGKGRVAVFDTRLRDDAVRRLALKVELPEALRLEQFHLAYQPIKNVGTEYLAGFEALVRWHHPRRGLVSPGEFIPAAEETGMIVGLGRWVLRQACEEAAFWNERSTDPLWISVNVSGLQLHQPGFVEDVLGTLATTGLPAHLLNLELTESVLVKHQRVESILAELRAAGVGIAIDDFGTGYSSLSYLQQFPATSLKIDRGFVSALVDGGDDGLVGSIVSIADALGLTTVAEGVETLEQLDAVRRLGCQLAQGFLLGRPRSAGEIIGMMENERMARSSRRRSGGEAVAALVI
jgi:diguanylate cyclase (GGDEF)-like protein/PAS domain S-box-containing protein